MSSLLFICPKTNQQAPSGIETDVQCLTASWRTMLKVHCPHCGEMHEISVSETYIDSALRNVNGHSTAQSELTEKEWQLFQQNQKFCRALTAAIKSGSETAAGVTATVRIRKWK